MVEDVESSFWNQCAGVSPDDRRNQRRIVWSTLAWASVYVAANQALKRELVVGPLAWVLASVPVVLGIVVLWVYGRFLRQTDELQRLIQLKALALGFGGSFFAYCSYSVFQRLGAPAIELQDATLVMVFLYLLGVFVGWSQYR